MNQILKFSVTAIFIFTLAACAVNPSAQNDSTSSPQTAAASAESASITSSTVGQAPSTTTAQTAIATSDTHDDATDYTWDEASVIPITLDGNSITAGSGVTVEGSRAVITAAGTYSLSGTLTDGQIVVNTADKEPVRLILNGVDLHSSTSAPISVEAAKKVLIVLAENSRNMVGDDDNYVFASAETDEPNAAIFSTADLTIFGSGSLSVTARYHDGITSKDGLIIASGNISVQAADDGIRGKDYLVIKDGSITINSGGDGLISDNEEDAARGYVNISAGSIQVTSGGDALQAQSSVAISGGLFSLQTGGAADATSAKGIKGVNSVTIDGGTFTINSADDSLHSNGDIQINGGSLTLSSGDDGMHADATLTINGGDIQVAQSYEGLESAVITINDGNIDLVSSDDGINVAGGNDGSGMNPGGAPGGMPGGPGQDNFSYAGDYYLYIHGGTIVMNAGGDGLDSNGAIEMTGGVVLVNGPTESMNGAIDYQGTFNITGGFLLAVGSAGMAQAPGSGSSQYSVLIGLDSPQSAGTLIHIQNSAGEDILTFAPAKAYQAIAYSSPQLTNGSEYALYLGGSSSGDVVNGLYSGGSYAGGTQYASFTTSSMVTQVGSLGRGGMPGQRQRP